MNSYKQGKDTVRYEYNKDLLETSVKGDCRKSGYMSGYIGRA